MLVKIPAQRPELNPTPNSMGHKLRADIVERVPAICVGNVRSVGTLGLQNRPWRSPDRDTYCIIEACRSPLTQMQPYKSQWSTVGTGTQNNNTWLRGRVGPRYRTARDRHSRRPLQRRSPIPNGCGSRVRRQQQKQKSPEPRNPEDPPPPSI